MLRRAGDQRRWPGQGGSGVAPVNRPYPGRPPGGLRPANRRRGHDCRSHRCRRLRERRSGPCGVPESVRSEPLHHRQRLLFQGGPGRGTNYPPNDSGWAVETALDLDAVSSVCPACHLLLVEGRSASLDDLGTAADTAVSLGAGFISNSYGVPNENSAEVGFDHYYDHRGVVVTASTGDTGNVVNSPASSPVVTAVGGTRLRGTPQRRAVGPSLPGQVAAVAVRATSPPRLPAGRQHGLPEQGNSGRLRGCRPGDGVGGLRHRRTRRMASSGRHQPFLSIDRWDVGVGWRAHRRHLPLDVPLLRHALRRRPERHHLGLERQLRHHAVQRRPRVGRPHRSRDPPRRGSPDVRCTRGRQRCRDRRATPPAARPRLRHGNQHVKGMPTRQRRTRAGGIS